MQSTFIAQSIAENCHSIEVKRPEDLDNNHGTVVLNSPQPEQLRALDEVFDAIRREDVLAAETHLETLRDRDEVSGNLYKLLHAELLLLKHEYSTLRRLVQEDTNMSPEAKCLRLVGAHGEALVGDALVAFREAKEAIRDASRFEEKRARANRVAGISCYRAGHYRWAMSFFRSALSYYRLVGDSIQVAYVLVNLALVEKSEGRVHVALARLDEACSNLPVTGCSNLRIRLLINRSICSLKLGQIQRAHTYLMEAKALSEAGHGADFESSILNNLGHIFRMQGNLHRAAEFHAAALQASEREGSLRKQCLAHEFLGEVATEEGNLDLAGSHLAKAHALAARIAPKGDLMLEVLRRQGEFFAKSARPEDARKALRQGLALCSSRKELRESFLTRRALLLLDGHPDVQQETHSILTGLDSLGDRFEYGNTVCKLLESRIGKAPWFDRYTALALNYLDVLESPSWSNRLQRAAGHSRNLQLAPLPETKKKEPSQASPLLSACLEAVALTSRTKGPVLILGETGSGKEIFARRVHEASPRKLKRLIAVNCAALPEALVESELFGHAKGTFTGAYRDKQGLLEAAIGGSLLLDEIGDLELSTQVKLLRFLDTGEYRRIGETKDRNADVRVIAATNKDLIGLVKNGKFREDLYFRLNVFRIDVPPLRLRREDILALADEFLASTEPSSRRVLTADLQEWMLDYEWPGNVRELRNLCEFLSAKTWGRSTIGINDLPSHLSRQMNQPGGPSLARQRVEFERNQLATALSETGGHIQEAAKLLGLGRNTVTRKLAEHSLRVENYSKKEQ